MAVYLTATSRLSPLQPGGRAHRFENPKVAKTVPPVVNFGDTLNFGEPLADSFAKDFTLELDRVKVGALWPLPLVEMACAAGRSSGSMSVSTPVGHAHTTIP